MHSILFYILIGGGLGLVLGLFKLPGVSARPLIAALCRRTFSGAMLGVLFCLTSGCGGNSTAMNQSTANVKHITDAEFDAEVTHSTQPVVVDCYATWCGPCRQLAPLVDHLADEYAGKIKFCKVNVDESPNVSRKFQIQAIPTLLFFKQGKLVNTSVGLLDKPNLIERLEALLQTNSVPARTGQ
jgi:thioredoxin 1